MKRFFAMLLILCLSLGTAALAQEELNREEDAQAFIEQVLEGNVDAYYDRFTPEVQAAISKDDLTLIGTQLEAQFGKLVAYQGTQVMGPAVNVGLQYENGPLIAQVVYDGNNMISGFGFLPGEVQQEQAPLGENEEAVTVGPKALEGVLTMPVDAEGPVPAVVLVHGSGASNRDEAIGNIAVFRDIAEGLSAQGIAVLRYDKRTYAMNQGAIDFTPEDIANLTTYDETIEDAVAAAQMLRADERFSAVYVLGHSQGGMLAGRILKEGADADGLIILAGTLRHLAELIVDQLTALNIEGFEADIENAGNIFDMSEEEARALTILGSPAYFIWEEAQHDLVAIAEEGDVPLLILQGTEDANVYADVDYVLWQEFAAEHPERSITFHLYEGLDHFFTVDNKVDQAVMDDIAAWIHER